MHDLPDMFRMIVSALLLTKDIVEQLQPSNTPVSYYQKCLLGGVLACGITHAGVTPLDVAKTNVQVDPLKYTSSTRALALIAKEEGAAAVFKGVVPTFIGYSLQGAFKFGLYEVFKDTYSNLAGESAAKQYRPWIWVVASASAEFFADIALCPLEMTKIKVQTAPKGTWPTEFVPAWTRMWSERARTGFPYGSLQALWARQIPYTIAKFVFFEQTVSLFYTYLLTDPKETYSKLTQLSVTFASGYIAGVGCAIVSHPADSVVSLLGKDGNRGKSVSALVSDAGLRNILTKGLGTRMLMIGTLTGLQWYIYDTFKTYMGLGTTGGNPVPPTRLYPVASPLQRQFVLMASESVQVAGQFVGAHTLSTTQRAKTVYLVRHAESVENVATIGLLDSFRALYSSPRPQAASQPAASEQNVGFFGRISALASSVSAFSSTIGTDAELSPLGRQQIAEVRDKLFAAQFWEQGVAGASPGGAPELLVHSDLKRTTETAYGIMGLQPPHQQPKAPNDRDEGTFSEPRVVAPGLPPVVASSALRERAVSEFFTSAPLDSRVAKFTEWLAARPEQTVVVVGHAHHFKLLMNHAMRAGDEAVKWKMRNLDVWEGRFESVAKTSSEEGGRGAPDNSAAKGRTLPGWFVQDAWVKRFGTDQAEVNELFDYEEEKKSRPE
ncbi:Cu/Pi carrier [Gonapodya sp. JEL0774]|nr:Cu/Pi carrier [Gonapodya sp. JEL0774]